MTYNDGKTSDDHRYNANILWAVLFAFIGGALVGFLLGAATGALWLH